MKKNNFFKTIKRNLAVQVLEFYEKLKNDNVEESFFKAVSYVFNKENLNMKGWPKFKKFLSAISKECKKIEKEKQEIEEEKQKQEIYKIIDQQKRRKHTGEALAKAGREGNQLKLLYRDEY